ncbi:hypothetical protein CCR95_09990 [Thiocystis minor]|uniref:hypothetical protein n=1 Tax=Thiocystis minor TaxID=61597 RepID=UPI001912053E|nr:hypothetical protein [Thiocystis minor]MBK5964405.1 hypothetical protein [Thiocystis minor]
MRLAALAVVALTATLLNACVDSGTTRPSEPSRLPAVDTAAAQRLISPDETLQTLNFPVVGATQVSGTIDGDKSPAYLVPVATGQTLTVTLESPSNNAYFNVHDAADSSGAALFNGNSGERTARLTAPADMTYVIRPFQPRASARRNERLSYRFMVERG